MVKDRGKLFLPWLTLLFIPFTHFFTTFHAGLLLSTWSPTLFYSTYLCHILTGLLIIISIYTFPLNLMWSPLSLPISFQHKPQLISPIHMCPLLYVTLYLTLTHHFPIPCTLLYPTNDPYLYLHFLILSLIPTFHLLRYLFYTFYIRPPSITPHINPKDRDPYRINPHLTSIILVNHTLTTLLFLLLPYLLYLLFLWLLRYPLLPQFL